MLKTVSSVANALGALNYKGTWDAATNTPTLASGVGTQGDYYVVSVAGATDLDGITNWGVGDWAAFNGSVWQRVEGGADGNFVNLTANNLTVEAASGGEAAKFVTNDATADNNAGMLIYNIASATPATRNAQLILDPSGANASGGDYLIISAKGDNSASIINYHATSTLALGTGGIERLQISSTGNVTLPVGNLVIGTSGKGIDFSATAGTGTSELLDDYEEGTYTAILTPTTGSITLQYDQLKYTKIGRLVTVMGLLRVDSVSSPIGDTTLNLPFTISTGSNYSNRSASSGYGSGFVSINSNEMSLVAVEGSAVVYFINTSGAAASGGAAGQQFQALTEFLVTLSYHTD